MDVEFESRELKVKRLWVFDSAQEDIYDTPLTSWKLVKKHSKVYYWNTETDETTYEDPSICHKEQFMRELKSNKLFMQMTRRVNEECLT